MPLKRVKKTFNTNGGRNKGNENKIMRNTKLKEMYVIRYDDFKVFCRIRNDANKIFISIQKWLEERLHLEISPEKSKVINLRKSYTEFLGFKLKVVPNKRKYKVRSHICDKEKLETKEELLEIIKALEHPRSSEEVHALVNKYNAKVIGKHQYFRYATNVYMDFDEIAFQINGILKNRMKERLKKNGNLKDGYIKDTYGKSKQMRYLDGYPLIPLAFIKTKNAMHLKRGVCSYTTSGRELIHEPLGVDLSILRELMTEEHGGFSVEYMDNRISLYATQYGKCAILGCKLLKNEIHCHHKTPRAKGGSDRYENLIIIHKDVHRLIHATLCETIKYYLTILNLDKKQIQKVNSLRNLLELEPI